MIYNHQIHHRRSIRLKGYDYSKAGLYFITICTHDRECLFGKITNGKMTLNDAGKIAHDCWLKIPEHFPNVILHEHIVMPNHVHGIIELTENDATPVPHPIGPKCNKFQKIIPRSIGSIIRGYKIGVTKWFRNKSVVGIENFQSLQPVWQRNYYEHIILNEKSYQIISDYIINNPVKWNDDNFYMK